jgi:hypothetical protein
MGRLVMVLRSSLRAFVTKDSTKDKEPRGALKI